MLYQCGTPDPTTLSAGSVLGVRPDMAAFEVPLHSIGVHSHVRNLNGHLVRDNWGCWIQFGGLLSLIELVVVADVGDGCHQVL